MNTIKQFQFNLLEFGLIWTISEVSYLFNFIGIKKTLQNTLRKEIIVGAKKQKLIQNLKNQNGIILKDPIMIKVEMKKIAKSIKRLLKLQKFYENMESIDQKLKLASLINKTKRTFERQLMNVSLRANMQSYSNYFPAVQFIPYYQYTAKIDKN